MGLRVGPPLLWSWSCGCGWTCGDDALWQAVRSWWSSSTRVLHISSSELIVRIGAASLLCEEPPVWHRPTQASWGRCDGIFLGGRSLVKSESLAHGGVMTMTPADNLDDDACLQWCVCGLCLVARVVVCVLAMVVFYDGRRGCLYRFLADFPLIKRPTLFSLINENGKYFACFQKKKLCWFHHVCKIKYQHNIELILFWNLNHCKIYILSDCMYLIW
jgi:hypothetical protein